MREMSAGEVSAIRHSYAETQAAFGQRVRCCVAAVLGLGVEEVPAVAHTQVSRWEDRGLDPSRMKLQTLVYLVALSRLRPD